MRRKRRSKAGTFVMILVALALTAFILFRQVFIVRTVEINGSRSIPDETLIRTARIELGSSIFAVDAEQMRRGVNALGTIALDGVEVRYPSTVILNVRERTQRAMLLHQGEIRLLDVECCLVDSVDSVPNTDLIYVNGMTVMSIARGEQLQAAKGQVEAYCSIMQAIDENAAYMYVSEINLSDVSNLQLITRTGITVELGDDTNMMNKIAFARSAVADLEQRNEGGGILDVRGGNKADYSRPGT